MGQHAADGGGDGGGAGGVACELGMPPDGNVRNSVLYQLAERKQENHALSLDLAAAQAKLRDLDAEIGAAQLGLGAAQREKDAAASARDGLGEELRAARAERETQQAEAAELTGERSVMLEYIQELAEKVAALESLGIRVSERVPIETGLNTHNESYLAVKVSKMGHLLKR